MPRKPLTVEELAEVQKVFLERMSARFPYAGFRVDPFKEPTDRRIEVDFNAVPGRMSGGPRVIFEFDENHVRSVIVHLGSSAEVDLAEANGRLAMLQDAIAAAGFGSVVLDTYGFRAVA